MSEVKAAPFAEWRLAGASKGVALTTTLALTALPIGTNYLKLKPRNFATAVVARYALNPYLVILKTTDLLLTAAALTDGSENMQDGSTATTLALSSLATLANGGSVYVGAPLQYRGVAIAASAYNINASALTVTYWTGAAWTTTSATDGTDNPAGTTLGADGNVTWTVPTDWAKDSLSNISVILGNTILTFRSLPPSLTRPLFWTRWVVSAALDSSVTLTSMLPLNRSTAYDELLENEIQEQVVHRGVGGLSCVEALTDAGTGNLLISVASVGGFV